MGISGGESPSYTFLNTIHVYSQAQIDCFASVSGVISVKLKKLRE